MAHLPRMLKSNFGSVFEQEDQVALKRSLDFCLKLVYRYLLKAGHLPADT